MSGFAPADDSSRTTRIIRRIGLSVTTLLLIGCLLGGVWFLLPVLFPQIWANYLSRVQGQAELIVSAQQQLGIGWLSPDGRWIVWKPLQEQRMEQSPVIMDLVGEQRHTLSNDMREMRWLNSDQFVVLTSADTYYLLDIHTFTKVPIPIFPEIEYKNTDDIAKVRNRWRGADTMYSILDFGISGYTIVTFEQNNPQIYRTGYNFVDHDAKSLIDQVPHIDVPKYGWSIVKSTGDHVYSPDGRFYVTHRTAIRADVNERAEIYTSDGQLVAYAYKAGWAPYVLGWAHDGSGVYVQFRKSGGAASMFMPYKPLFKLSPLSPEESRWQLARTIVLWAAGIAIVGAVGWWLAARRRRRQWHR